jgi:molybdopterin-guanine dinucleotide biosynthesis protein A
MQDSKVTGIILAGGKSSRMGSNKALMLYKNQRLIDMAIANLTPLVEELLISSNEPIPDIGLKIVSDIHKNIGPIGGLHACLTESKTAINLVVPCDVPMLPEGLYENMLGKMGSFDAVIPKYADGKLEPLIAMYNKSSAPAILEQINQNDYKIVNLLKKLKVCYMEVPETLNLHNINYPTDLV